MTWTKKLVLAVLVAVVLAGAVRAQGSPGFIGSGQFLIPPVDAVRAQTVEEYTVEAASEVLREIMSIPARSIPESLLAEAHGVAIMPGTIKGSFVVGVRHGKGVVVARDASGAWTAPVFITATGGSIGWQAGVESTDVVVVFRNRRGVDGLLRGKFTLGADASIAAGPLGREASVATDAQLKAEILSYSRSRGLFAGVAIDGAAMLINHTANAAYYAPKPGQPKDAMPASALKLVEQIAAYAGARNKAAADFKDASMMSLRPQADDAEAIRAQLMESSLRLQKILDPQWKKFLSLPEEVYGQGKTPPRDAVDKSLSRYSAISNDARYQDLSARAEFQETHTLLLHYRHALEGSKTGALKLPPPPPR